MFHTFTRHRIWTSAIYLLGDNHLTYCESDKAAKSTQPITRWKKINRYPDVKIMRDKGHQYPLQYVTEKKFNHVPVHTLEPNWFFVILYISLPFMFFYLKTEIYYSTHKPNHIMDTTTQNYKLHFLKFHRIYQQTIHIQICNLNDIYILCHVPLFTRGIFLRWFIKVQFEPNVKGWIHCTGADQNQIRAIIFWVASSSLANKKYNSKYFQ